MNAPVRINNPFPPGGSPSELRQTVAELMAVVEMRAGIVQSYAQIADDRGLAYGLRCLTAELKAALSAAGMLAEIARAEHRPSGKPALHQHETREARL